MNTFIIFSIMLTTFLVANKTTRTVFFESMRNTFFNKWNWLIAAFLLLWFVVPAVDRDFKQQKQAEIAACADNLNCLSALKQQYTKEKIAQFNNE